MAVDMDKARKIVELENRAKEALKELNTCSADLMKVGMDLKITGWDWYRPGDRASISTQGNLRMQVVDKDSRAS